MADVDRDDHIERTLLDARRKALEERFGAVFFRPDDSLPPDVERTWLDSIERFEEAVGSSRTTTVRELVGNPPVRPLGEIPPEELPEAVDWLMELLAANDIVVQISNTISLAETYRFLSEELMAAETDDIHVEGFSTLFLYDDFHPDERADAERTAREFCFAIFERSEADLVRLIGGAHDGDSPQFRRAGALPVVGHANWTGVLRSGRTQIGAAGPVSLTLTRCPFGGWDVIAAQLPGLETVASEA